MFGWIIFHQHLGDSFNWNLPWADYKAGFGDITSNFWLGLERIHLLTNVQPYRLRMEMEQESDGKWFTDEYWTFHIGDEPNDQYRLDVAGYSGDGGNSLQHPSNSNWMHDGMMFTTYDHDNSNSGTCGNSFGSWWFNGCYAVCLACNGAYHRSYVLPTDYLVNSRMMIKPREM